MTINLTELRDEPLGKHPIQAALNCYPSLCYINGIDAQQDVVVEYDQSSFTFDVEGLGDEALDDSPSVSALMCGPCNYCGLGDEPLDDSPSVECFIYLPCYGGPLSDEALDTPALSAQACALASMV